MNSASAGGRVAVIGLDCVPPRFVFEEWRTDLPHLNHLIQRGVHGPLTSVLPPITVPAWMCMMTGQDPGSLGIYGFRNRRDHSYTGFSFASSLSVSAPTVWDLLGQAGRESIVLGVPLTYPPKRIAGALVSCFLTPDTNRIFTYPPELTDEVQRVADGYILDASGFRNLPRDRLLEQLYAMAEKRFRVAQHLLTTRPWDFFILVEMATDRLHHAFWRYYDPEHRLHEPQSPYRTAIRDFYRWLDEQIGQLLAVLGEETTVFVVSDHGAQRMDGGICLNEWLIQNGYLVLKEPPSQPIRFNVNLVDWSRTRAWGDGGYYGRIFLNVQGREPEGVVPPEEVEALRDELIAGLEALGDEQGRPIGTRVYRPEQIYQHVRGVPPDLIAIFGELHWRSIGQVGTGRIHVFENDTGPDDANHSMEGILIAAGPTIPPRPEPIANMSLLDVAPTLLELLGLSPPEECQGSSLLPRFRDQEAFTEEDEEKIAQRLEELGYL